MTIFTGKRKVDSRGRNQLLLKYSSKFIYLFIFVEVIPLCLLN